MDQNNPQAQPTSQNHPPQIEIIHNKLLVKIRNPEKLVFEGEVAAVSCINEQGPFDILMQHGNFISIIKQKIIIHFKDGKTQEYPIESAVLKVIGNKVNIFLGLEKLKK